MFDPPEKHALTHVARIPQALRKSRRSAWADARLHGAELDAFLEGPVMTPEGDLLMVDIPFGRILRLSADLDWSVVTEYDGWPNGLKRLPDGRLLVADHRLGLLRITPDSGVVEVLADAFEGRPLHGPNDLTLARDGTIFFTDQGASGLDAPYGRVLRFRDGELQLVLGNVPGPNGLVLSEDERTLFLAVTRANAVWRVPLTEAGTAEKAGLFLQLSGGIGPDGLAWCDSSRDLLVAHPGLGVWSFSRDGRPVRFFSAEGATYTTNLVAVGGGRFFVTESLRAEIHELHTVEQGR